MKKIWRWMKRIFRKKEPLPELKDVPDLSELTISQHRSLQRYKNELYERAGEFIEAGEGINVKDLTWKMEMVVQNQMGLVPEEDRPLLLLAAGIIQRRIMFILSMGARTKKGKKVLKEEALHKEG